MKRTPSGVQVRVGIMHFQCKWALRAAALWHCMQQPFGPAFEAGRAENLFIFHWTRAVALDRVFANQFQLFPLHPEEEDLLWRPAPTPQPRPATPDRSSRSLFCS